MHISNICKSASKQLNVLVRLIWFSGFEERKVLINSFILSNFNYCPLVWSLNKVENLRKRALRFLHNDYSSSYEEIFKKSGKSTVNISNYCSLCNEIFKTLNDIKPSFIKDIFKLRMTNRPTWEKYKLNLETPNSNQLRFGTKRLKCLSPKVWHSLPYHIKSSENLIIFKTLKKNWNGTACSCKICKNWNYKLSASFLPL